MNLYDVKTAIASTLSGVAGLRGFAYEPGQITPPSAWVTNSAIDYRLTMGETDMRASIRVTVVMQSGDSEKAQRELDNYLTAEGSKSIVAALRGNVDLGGTCDYVDAVAVEDAGLIEVGGNVYVGARLLVEVVG